MTTGPRPPLDTTLALFTLGRELWKAALAPTAPESLVRLRRRMARPTPGDLVIEVSAFGRRWDRDCAGWLLRIEDLDACGRPTADLFDREACLDNRYVIEPLDRPGEEQGWQNATFVALPLVSSQVWLADQP